MRRSSAPVALTALGVGVFLLVLAPLLAWYVTPQAKRTPTDINQTTLFEGQGSYFDAATRTLREDQKLTITRRVLGDVSDSEDSGKAVWDVSTVIDTNDTLRFKDPRRSFQWTTERWVTDKVTNKPVHCCGEDTGVPGKQFAGDAYLRFPFDVKRGTTYLWWDNTLQDTVEMTYERDRTVQGRKGLLFTGSVPEAVKTGTRQVPGALVGLPERPQVFAEEYYSNKSVQLVVDQRTGRVLYASTAPHKTLRQPGGNEDVVTLLRSDTGIAFTEDTQKKQVALAEDDNDQLVLISTVAPVSAGVLGLLLAALGGFLLIRSHEEGEEEREPDGAPRQPVTA